MNPRQYQYFVSDGMVDEVKLVRCSKLASSVKARTALTEMQLKNAILIFELHFHPICELKNALRFAVAAEVLLLVAVVSPHLGFAAFFEDPTTFVVAVAALAVVGVGCLVVGSEGHEHLRSFECFVGVAAAAVAVVRFLRTEYSLDVVGYPAASLVVMVAMISVVLAVFHGGGCW